MPEIGLAVVAGGSSRRMGQDKGLVEVGGKAMARWVLDAGTAGIALAGGSAAQLIVANSPGYEQFGVEVVPDLRPGLGPVAGIETALSLRDSPVTIVLACDVPMIAPTLIARLVESIGTELAAVTFGPSGLEPCCAAYSHECLAIASSQLDSGDLAARSFLARIEAEGGLLPVSPEGAAEIRGIRSLNHPEDLANAEELLAEPG